jgi:hypothetical protein
MFPLKTKTFPENPAELAARLNESLRGVFQLQRDPAVVQEVAYPHLSSLTVYLDGAQMKGPPPPIPSVSGTTGPALTVDAFSASGSGLSVGPALLDFALEATGVTLNRANDAEGNIVLLLQKAAQGRVDISTATAGLEALIAEVATAEAGKHGVKIEDLQLSLRSDGPRSLAAEVSLRGRKLFLSAGLRITGRVDLDDALNARVSGLDCAGEGAFGGMACGVLKPHLEKVNGREFPLMSLPMGEVRLRDIRVAAGDKLTVNAEFGSST